jgi:hypothetical protein
MVFTLIVLFFVLLVVIGVVAWRMMKGEDVQGRKK